MRRRATALAFTALLATGLAACGGDPSEESDVVPRSTPALVAPENTGLPAATGGNDEPARTSTSTTSTTETTPDAQAPAGSATPTPATTQQTPQAAPEAGGQQAPPAQTQTQEQGGTGGGNSGGFSDFCAENPGACPDE